MQKVNALKSKALAALLAVALVFSLAPTMDVFAATEIPVDENNKVSVGGTDFYYVTHTSGAKDVEIDFSGSHVLATEIGSSGIYYASKTGAKPDSYYYGSADITYPDYWKSEGLTLPSASNWTKSSTKIDNEGFNDMGGFDTVTRSTSKHGTYRAGFQFILDVYGYTTDKSALTKFKSEHDPAITEDGKITPVPREGVAADVVSCKDGAKAFTSNGTEYTYDSYSIRGIQRVPVNIAGTTYVSNLILKAAGKTYIKKLDDFVLNGKDGSNRKVDSSTGNMKELKADGEYGPITAGKHTNSRSKVVEDTALDASVTENSDNMERATTLNYNHAFGEYVTAEVGLKNANSTTMKKADMLNYVTKFTTATYEYYGKDSTYKNRVAKYGSMASSDTWWSANHGARIDAGFQFDSYRMGSPDGQTKNKQFGYWKITFRSAGYEDVVSQFYLGPEAKFEKDTYTIAKGASLDLSSAVKSPRNKKIEYTSSNSNIVEVHPTSGAVVAKANGTATITVDVNKGVKIGKEATAGEYYETATCKVTVGTPGVKLNKTKATLYKGVSGKNKVALKATVVGGSKTVAWKSSNSKVATVNSKGVVTAEKKGTAVISATAGGKIAKATITVKSPTYKVNKSNVTLKKGKKFTIKVTKKSPSGKVTFISKNKKVASVSSKGVITAKKKGSTTITVKCNGVNKSIKVKVK